MTTYTKMDEQKSIPEKYGFVNGFKTLSKDDPRYKEYTKPSNCEYPVTFDTKIEDEGPVVTYNDYIDNDLGCNTSLRKGYNIASNNKDSIYYKHSDDDKPKSEAKKINKLYDQIMERVKDITVFVTYYKDEVYDETSWRKNHSIYVLKKVLEALPSGEY